MNVVVLSGRLTADPDVRYKSDTGEPIASYTLAVDRGKDQADFIRCVAFEKRAEFAKTYLKKGTKIIVTGRIRTGSYTNKDGQKVYTTDVWISSQEFAESRQDAPPAPEGNGPDGFVSIPDSIDDEGLPFH